MTQGKNDSPVLTKNLPYPKMIMLDLITAQQAHAACNHKLTIQECFEQIQTLLVGYMTDLMYGTKRVPPERIVTIHINNNPIAKFYLL